MELISVAALAENRVIGRDGDLPWPSIPADRRQYRDRVAGAPVILGRRTFDSMREDLPGSHQIVLSRSRTSFEVPTATRAPDVPAAIAIAESLGAERVYVIGGGEVYEALQPHLDRMVLSRVHGEYEGDTYYPAFDPDAWTLVAETPFERFTLEEWVRTSRPSERSG